MAEILSMNMIRESHIIYSRFPGTNNKEAIDSEKTMNTKENAKPMKITTVSDTLNILVVSAPGLLANLKKAVSIPKL